MSPNQNNNEHKPHEDGNQSESKQKTREELAAERLERYQKNPDSFIETKDIIVCSVKNPKSGYGMAVFIGNVPRSDLAKAKTEIDHIITKNLMRMDMEAEMRNKSFLHLTPGKKNGILNQGGTPPGFKPFIN